MLDLKCEPPGAADFAMMITIPARFEPLALKKIFVLTLFCLSMLHALLSEVRLHAKLIRIQ